MTKEYNIPEGYEARIEGNKVIIAQKESENERIRKFLHHTFTALYLCRDKTGKWHGEPVTKILTYLEKRKEQKPTIYHKFKVGDTIHKIGENTVYPRTIEKIKDGDYVCNNDKCSVSIKFQDDYELVEQKPAARVFTFDDVLALESAMVLAKDDKELYGALKSIFERVHDAYHGEQTPLLDNKDAHKAAEDYQNFRMSCGIKDPTMLSEIEDAYYEGAISKQKESLHIPQMCKENANSFTDEDEIKGGDFISDGKRVFLVLANVKERNLGETGSTYCEGLILGVDGVVYCDGGDFKKFKRATSDERAKFIYDLKVGVKLKEQQPAELSEGDKFVLEAACNALEIYGHHKLSNMLKSLRPQPKQEWSKEEKQKLNRIYEILGYAAVDKGFLTSKRIIGDKEAIELQDFLRSIAKPTKSDDIEYIRKDALLEWAKNYKKLGVSDDFAYAMDTLIKHLNSM